MRYEQLAPLQTVFPLARDMFMNTSHWLWWGRVQVQWIDYVKLTSCWAFYRGTMIKNSANDTVAHPALQAILLNRIRPSSHHPMVQWRMPYIYHIDQRVTELCSSLNFLSDALVYMIDVWNTSLNYGMTAEFDSIKLPVNCMLYTCKRHSQTKTWLETNEEVVLVRGYCTPPSTQR